MRKNGWIVKRTVVLFKQNKKGANAKMYSTEKNTKANSIGDEMFILYMCGLSNRADMSKEAM